MAVAVFHVRRGNLQPEPVDHQEDVAPQDLHFRCVPPLNLVVLHNRREVCYPMPHCFPPCPWQLVAKQQRKEVPSVREQDLDVPWAKMAT